MKIFLLIGFTLLMISCGNGDKIPSNILASDKMENVLWDLMRTDQFLNDYVFIRDSSLKKDSVSIVYYKRIFSEQGITREQFKESFSYYKAHPGYLKTVMDSIVSRPELSPGELYKPLPRDSTHSDSIKKTTLDTVHFVPGPRKMKAV
jgi:hypothetical protein